jgi:hypothetical protein
MILRGGLGFNRPILVLGSILLAGSVPLAESEYAARFRQSRQLDFGAICNDSDGSAAFDE